MLIEWEKKRQDETANREARERQEQAETAEEIEDVAEDLARGAIPRRIR